MSEEEVLTELAQRGVSRRRLLELAGGAIAVAAMPSPAFARGLEHAATPKPKRGGIAVVGKAADVVPSTVFSVNGQNIEMNRLIYNTLTELDHKTLQPKPALATAWTISEGGRVYTLELRNDVKFHDGRPFGPQDVIDNIKLRKDPARGSQLRNTASVIQDMHASGNRLRLGLSLPILNLFDLFETMYIVDARTLPDILSGKNLNGTGPFMWQSWTPNASLKLTKNPHYWKKGLPYLDGVNLQVYGDAQALVAGIKTQESHITLNLDSPQIAEFLTDPNFFVKAVDTNADCNYIGINVASPPLDKAAVRQAIGWAIDRTALYKNAFGAAFGSKFPAGVMQSIPWPKHSPAYDAKLAQHYTYNPARAKALLASAGVGPFATEIAVPNANNAVAQIVQSNLKDVGITAKIQQYTGAQFFQKLQSASFPGLWTSGHLFANLHPATLVTSALPFNSVRNASNFNNPTYNALVQKIWTTTNPKELKTAYRNITNLLLASAFVLELNVFGDVYVGSKLTDWGVNMFDYLDFDAAFLA